MNDKDNDKDMASRIRAARLQKGLSQQELADKLVVSLSTIQNYERGTTEPNIGKIRVLALILGVDSLWLAGGQEAADGLKDKIKHKLKEATAGFRDFGQAVKDMRPNLNKAAERLKEHGFPIDQDEYIYIKVVAAKLSAGGGSFEDDSEIIDYLAFKRSWIRRKGRPGDMVLMEVMGDSMLPLIDDNDMVLLDTSKTDIRPGKIYAVAYDDCIYLKRVFTEPRKIILRSDNDVYSDITINLDDESQVDYIKIIGRAIWWCHDERI